jgi:hypothetical protein
MEKVPFAKVVAYNHISQNEEVVLLKNYTIQEDEKIGIEYIEGLCARCNKKLSFYLKPVSEADAMKCRCGYFEGIAYIVKE